MTFHKQTSNAARTSLLLLLLAAGCTDSDSSGDASADASTRDASSQADSGGLDSGASADASADAGDASTDNDASVDSGSPTDPEAVDLGAAETFAVLAKTGISTIPPSVITGDIGVSPAAATYITGFSLTAHASNAFATSPQVSGKVYAANYAAPTPAKMTAAIGDMVTAFTDAAGRAPAITELGAGDIGGMTLEPGVYSWSTGLSIPTDVTLTGGKTDVWIFQVAKDLSVSNGRKITLAGGALPENVFWQVSGKVTLGTTSHFQGVVLSQTSIVVRTGASIHGRLFAQTAVNLDTATVLEPAL